MFGDAVILYCVIDCLFLLPVDQKLGPRTRDPADIGLVMDLEQERLVRHAGLQAFNARDLGLRNLQYLRDQLHGDIVGMVLVALIEEAELLKILELIYLVVRLLVDIHLRNREMVLSGKMAVDLAV